MSDSDPKDTKAVALQYDREAQEAPKVVAKGDGFVAEQIIAIAEANGVTIKKDADLVEVLSAIDINEFIPLEAYTAVAEILSYIYKQQDD